MKMKELVQIVRPLLEWYGQCKRVLPWRQNKDPYRVWVSEIMLQQTRVDAVIPYYERFMKELPTIEALALADEENLMKLWEGLGYYSRVKNLQKAARIICSDYQGKFPEEFEQILKLPGIGEYTAGAISSIAFEKHRSAVDGNVLRVMSRLMEDEHDIMDTKYRKYVTEELAKVYPDGECGDFTQSIMELGAMVCLPNGAPKCEECPLRDMCGAYQSKTQMQYPVKKKKAERKILQKTVWILLCGDAIAIRKRGDEGVLSGMWELPNLDEQLSVSQAKKWLKSQGIAHFTIKEMPIKKHIFSHLEWHMAGYLIEVDEKKDILDWTWMLRSELEQNIALPTAFKIIYDSIEKERD